MSAQPELANHCAHTVQSQAVFLEDDHADERARNIIGQAVTAERLDHGTCRHRVHDACMRPSRLQGRLTVEPFHEHFTQSARTDTAIHKRRLVSAEAPLEKHLPRHRARPFRALASRDYDARLASHHMHAVNRVL